MSELVTSPTLEHESWVGKQVKDFYGQYIGDVVGITTDIDCTFESISVDCGSGGIKHLPFKQLIHPEFQKDGSIVFMPEWRLLANRFLTSKKKILGRMRALNEMIEQEDSSVREDASLFIQRYEGKLQETKEQELALNALLEKRLLELNLEYKRLRMVAFDSRLLFKSSEITEETHERIKTQTERLISFMENERDAIMAFRTSIEELRVEISAPTTGPNMNT